MRKKTSSAGGRSPNPTLVTRKTLDEMDENDAIAYTEQLMERLRGKQARDQRYLIPTCGLSCHSEMGEIRHRPNMLWI